MSYKIKEKSLISKIISEMNDYFVPTIWLGLVLSCLAAATYVTLSSSIRAANPPAPVYRDMNGDGINDKIIHRKVTRPGLFNLTKYSDLEEEVLYGVKIGDRTLYLPKEEFNGHNK